MISFEKDDSIEEKGGIRWEIEEILTVTVSMIVTEKKEYEFKMRSGSSPSTVSGSRYSISIALNFNNENDEGIITFNHELKTISLKNP